MVPPLLILIYLAFISLGLPDALLGSGWPVMQAELGTPYAFAGLALLVFGTEALRRPAVNPPSPPL